MVFDPARATPGFKARSGAGVELLELPPEDFG